MRVIQKHSGLLAASLILLACLEGAYAVHCVSYTPQTCVLSNVELKTKICHPRACEFDADLDFECGFTETGVYSYTPEPAGGCPDPFMTTRRAGPSPCGKRCCRADHEGDFHAGPQIPVNGDTSYTFQPTDNTCRYEEITRGQILHYFHSRGIPLVVAGDSMMRQFYLRLVMMLRGQRRLLDYHVHAHAYYATCPEGDTFRISTSSANVSASTPNNEYLKQHIPSFFSMKDGPGTVAGREALGRCSRRPTEFHYIHSPKWKNQVNMVPHYLESLPVGVKPVLLVSIGYWEGAQDIPQEYMDMLASLKDKVSKVLVVSIPRIRVPDPARREVYRVRNEFMKRWVDEQGEPYTFADFDAMSLSATSPPGGSANNWHYMCSVAWRTACNSCQLIEVDHNNGADPEGRAAPQIYQGNVERIHADDNGMCADEMNRNLWQAVLNTVVAPGKVVAEGRR